MLRLLCILGTFCWIWILPLSSQVSTNFRHYSVRDGLAQNSVFHIGQDSSGFIWFATRYGLNKFDGYHFKTFYHDREDSTTLSSNDTRALCYDKESRIMWVGTMNGLNAYHEVSNTFTRYFPKEGAADHLSNAEIHAIYLDKAQNLWIGTLDGLNLFDRQTQSFIRIKEGGDQGLSHPNIKEIFEDSKGNLWVGTANGLNKLIHKKGNTHYFEKFFHDPTDPTSLSHSDIKAIDEDQNGNLWIGTRYGLNKADPRTKTFTRFFSKSNDQHSLTNSNIGAISVGKTGNIWVGTIRGLNLYNPVTNTFQRFLNRGEEEKGLSNNSIISLFCDREGSLWIGTFRGGVNFWSQFINQFPYYQYNIYTNSINEGAVNSFWEDANKNLWIGTNGGGLNYFDTKTRNFSSFEEGDHLFGLLAGKQVKTIFEDEMGLWLGTYHFGLVNINTAKNTARTFVHDENKSGTLSDNDVYSIIRKEDYLYIGTLGGGLNKLNLNTNEFEYYTYSPDDSLSINSNSIRKLYKDSYGRIWVGTSKGLNLLGTQNGETVFKHLGDELTVYSIFEDSRGILWIGTYGTGLMGLDLATFQWTTYTQKDGLPGNIIFGILEDDEGDLWLSTNGGLANFDYELKTFYNYNLADGLKDQEFFYNAYYKTSKGELLFGGANGFTLFHPQNIIRNTYSPSIAFTDLKVLGKTIEINDASGLLDKPLNEIEELIFQHDQAIFSISFSALNFISPEKNRYKYRLKGLDKDWNDAIGTSSATYAIQEHGDYILEVKAANNHGIWGEKAQNLRIRVLPAPWRTWWAFCIYGALLVLALVLLIRFTQMRTSLYHKLELEQMEKHKQEELHQMKLRFFTNITHEFRTPLTLILSPLEVLQERYEEDLYLKKQLNTIQRSTQRLLNLVNQLLTFRKLEQEHLKLNLTSGDLVEYLEEIYQSFQPYADQRDINFSLQTEIKKLPAKFDFEKLEKVFYNLLSNAFKFTSDGGTIVLAIRQEGKCAIITVKDNGKGIKSEDLEKIFLRFYEGKHTTQPLIKSSGIGLSISKEVVQLHKGTIEVASQWGEGTVFTVTLPLNNGATSLLSIKKREKSSLDKKKHLPAQFISKPTTESFSIPTKQAEDLQAIKQGHTILIIDDNAEIRAYIYDLFKGQYRLFQAENAHKGIALAREVIPDLILSDVMMPGMDGIQLCAKLKQDLQTSHIPVLLLTARASDSSRIEGFEMGADDYITKPFHPKELIIRVRNLIESRKRLREQFVKVINLEPREITLTSADEQFLAQALDIVEKNIENAHFTMEDFAEELAVSRALLFNKLKALTEQTPNKFMQTIRLKRAAQLLESEKLTVSQVAYKVGFRDPKYFSKCFQKQYGHTPSNYAKRKT